MGKQMRSTATVLENRWTRQAMSRTIEAPAEQVWSVVADHEQWVSWYRLKEFRLVEGEELVMGAVIYEHEGPWKSTAEVVEFEPGRTLGCAMRTLNLSGLLSQHYRRIELKAIGGARSATEVTITGGFTFGPLGWILLPYTYPQMIAAMYFEYRSALKGLARHLASSR